LYNGKIEILINYKNKNIFSIEEIQGASDSFLTTLKKSGGITIEIAHNHCDKEKDEKIRSINDSFQRVIKYG
jgi:hypothetical protein